MKTKKTYVLTLSKVFMKGHPRAGEPTGFKEKLLAGEKIHTIRKGEYWRNVVDEVNAGRAVLSVREWVGRAYASKQVEIAQFDRLGWQRVEISSTGYPLIVVCYIRQLHINGQNLWRGKLLSSKKKVLVAKNDGLSIADFYSWFPNEFEGGIIHFTDFRY